MAPSAPGPPPEWAAELPPLIHAGLGDEEVDATRGRLIARMRAAPPSLKTFVETLGPFLTSDLEPQRDRAMMLLAEVRGAGASGKEEGGGRSRGERTGEEGVLRVQVGRRGVTSAFPRRFGCVSIILFCVGAARSGLPEAPRRAGCFADLV